MDLMTAREAARQLGVSAKTVVKWADKGRLEISHDPNGRRRYSRTDVEALAAARA